MEDSRLQLLSLTEKGKLGGGTHHHPSSSKRACTLGTFPQVQVSRGPTANSPCSLGARAAYKLHPPESWQDRHLESSFLSLAKRQFKGVMRKRNRRRHSAPRKISRKSMASKSVAVGSGSKRKGGKSQPVGMRVGDKVFLAECGDAKVVLDDMDSFLFRDGDILGKHVD